MRIHVRSELGDDGSRVDLLDARARDARSAVCNLRRLRRRDRGRVQFSEVDTPRLGLCEGGRRLRVSEGLHLGGGARRVHGAGR